MTLLDSMRDIVKHTHALGFIDMVKIVGTGTDAKLEAIDADKTVVMYADMLQPIDGIDSTVGLSRMAVLKGFMDLHAASKVSVLKETRGGVDVPTSVKFDNGAKDVSTFRFMSESMTNEQIKVPPFRGATWNITFKPEKKGIDRLSSVQSILGGFEKRFTVSTDGSTLLFSVGGGPSDNTTVAFAENITGTLKNSWSWPLTQVLNILKLRDNEDVTMHISDQGALKIEIESGCGKYSYILPAARG